MTSVETQTLVVGYILMLVTVWISVSVSIIVCVSVTVVGTVYVTVIVWIGQSALDDVDKLANFRAYLGRHRSLRDCVVLCHGASGPVAVAIATTSAVVDDYGFVTTLELSVVLDHDIENQVLSIQKETGTHPRLGVAITIRPLRVAVTTTQTHVTTARHRGIRHDLIEIRR